MYLKNFFFSGCDSDQSQCQIGPKFEFYPTHEVGCANSKFSSAPAAAFAECIRQGNCSCKQNNLLSSCSSGKAVWVGVRLIHVAVRLGEAWLVEFLIEQGCHPNPTTPMNKLRPLYIAAREGHTVILQLLLARGTRIFEEDLLTRDVCGRTHDDKKNILHHALSSIAQDLFPLDEKRIQQCLTFKILVKSGIWDVNHRDYNGETVLMSAVESEMVEEVEVLLNANADPNMLCDAGFSPLFRAVDRGNYAISSALIKAGADVNYTTCNKVTLLQAAVEDGNIYTYVVWLNSLILKFIDILKSKKTKSELHLKTRQRSISANFFVYLFLFFKDVLCCTSKVCNLGLFL